MENRKVRKLWGREFRLVENGLAEDQVVAFVNDLISGYDAAQQKVEHLSALKALAEQTVIAAENMAQKIRNEAKEESARILAETGRKAQEAIAEVKMAAEVEVREQIEAGRRQVILEVQKVLLSGLENLLEQARRLGEGIAEDKPLPPEQPFPTEEPSPLKSPQPPVPPKARFEEPEEEWENLRHRLEEAAADLEPFQEAKREENSEGFERSLGEAAAIKPRQQEPVSEFLYTELIVSPLEYLAKLLQFQEIVSAIPQVRVLSTRSLEDGSGATFRLEISYAFDLAQYLRSAIPNVKIEEESGRIKVHLPAAG